MKHFSKKAVLAAAAGMIAVMTVSAAADRSIQMQWRRRLEMKILRSGLPIFMRV